MELLTSMLHLDLPPPTHFHHAPPRPPASNFSPPRYHARASSRFVSLGVGLNQLFMVSPKYWVNDSPIRP